MIELQALSVRALKLSQFVALFQQTALCTAPLLFEKGEEKFLLLIRQLEVSVQLVLPVVLLVLIYLVH